jgi:hypothetical protein
MLYICFLGHPVLFSEMYGRIEECEAEDLLKAG